MSELDFGCNHATVSLPEDPSDLYVYFVIEVETGDYIKIGVSNNPERNLSTLQRGNPRKLELIGYIKGGHITETYLKRRFKEHKSDGGTEWFANSLLFRSQIDAIIEEKGVPKNEYNFLCNRPDQDFRCFD